MSESNVIQRKWRDVLDPAVFSWERGTPSWRKADLRVERLCDGGEAGGVTVRKLSRRWMTYGSLWLFSSSQQSATDRELNILGLF